MPRTSSDKLKLAKDEIANLSEVYQCKSFHGGILKCSCIMDLHGNIDTVKAFFTNEVKEFWDVKIHYDHHTDRKVIGIFLENICIPILLHNMKDLDANSRLNKKNMNFDYPLSQDFLD